MPSGPETGGRRLGPILLAPGVSPRQIPLFLSLVSIIYCMLGVATLMQPFLFTVMLHVPGPEQGRLAGALTTVQYVAVLVFVNFAGLLSDRLGRPAMIIIALSGVAACLVAFPLLSSIFALFVVRFLVGMFSTAHTTGAATMMVDYPANGSRGKFISLMVFVQSVVLAALVGWLGGHLPAWFVASGTDTLHAGRYTLWLIAGLGAVGVAAALWLKPVPTAVRARPSNAAGSGRLAHFTADLRAIWIHARRNPRFGIVMLVGLIIRSDYYIFSSFLAVWVVNAGRLHGIPVATAIRAAGGLVAVLTLTQGVAPLAFGWVADRVNRVAMLIASVFGTGLMLMSTGLVTDVFGPLMFAVVIMIGIGEAALTVSSQAMFGEEAPADMRGAAVGVFAFVGTFSVVVISSLSGLLFDKLGYAAPFMLVGAINILFTAGAALLVWRRAARPAIHGAR